MLLPQVAVDSRIDTNALQDTVVPWEMLQMTTLSIFYDDTVSDRISGTSRLLTDIFTSIAYDSFHALADPGLIEVGSLTAWSAAIGLRNRIEHDFTA